MNMNSEVFSQQHGHQGGAARDRVHTEAEGWVCRGSHSAQREPLGCYPQSCGGTTPQLAPPGALRRSQNLSNLKYPLARAACVPPDLGGMCRWPQNIQE